MYQSAGPDATSGAIRFGEFGTSARHRRGLLRSAAATTSTSILGRLLDGIRNALVASVASRARATALPWMCTYGVPTVRSRSDHARACGINLQRLARSAYSLDETQSCFSPGTTSPRSYATMTA
jgi:hypothetical protein